MQSPAEQVQPERGHRNEERIDEDGLPHVGTVIYPGQAYYSKVDCATGMLISFPPQFSLVIPNLAW